MTKQMIIRIEPEMQYKLTRLARGEGKSTSQVVRELIGTYVAERDISESIRELWQSISQEFKRKGVKRSDINRAIKEVRRRKHESSH